MIIPQSMSYANIAGLQPSYGLYSSVVPIIAYAFLGTSRQLAVGPVAMVSLLIATGLQGQLTRDECPGYWQQDNVSSPFYAGGEKRDQSDVCPEAYANLAIHTSLVVGLMQTVACFLRLGFLVSFLAHPVVSGFTSGAAIIIGFSQLQYFFGFSIPKSQYIYETLGHLVDKLDQTKWLTLVLGLSTWFCLWGFRQLAQGKHKKKFHWLRPTGPLIVCTIGILMGGFWPELGGCDFTICGRTICTATGGNASELTCGPDPDYKPKYIVGKIPSGFPPLSVDAAFDFSRLSTVISTALSVSLIGYMESIAIAKSLASKHKYELSAGQELFALGLSNVFGSLTSSYPVTGSFSRSAVNNTTGAKTNFAGIITALVVIIVLVALTEVFQFLPKFCLAAIVIASVTNLVDIKEFRYLWKVKKPDCLLWVLAFLGTLFLGVQNGLLGAVGASLVLVIYESVRPQIAVLWRLPETPIYRNIKQESLGQFVPGVLIVRLGASMYFANVAYIRDHISSLVLQFSEGLCAGAPVQYVIIEMTPVITIDSSALHMLEDMHRDLKSRDIRLAFATVGNRVHATLDKAGFHAKVGKQWFCGSVHEAVQYCVAHRAKKTAGGSSPKNASAAAADSDSEGEGGMMATIPECTADGISAAPKVAYSLPSDTPVLEATDVESMGNGDSTAGSSSKHGEDDMKI